MPVLSPIVLEMDVETGEVWDAPAGKYSVFDMEYVAKQKEARKKYTGIALGAASRMSPDKFIWEIYELSTLQTPTLSPANVTRMIYLSTFLHYDGFLAHSNGVGITMKSLPQLLKLSDRQFRNFWQELSTEKIFREQDGLVYVNANYFCRGRMRSKDVATMVMDGKYMTRLFIDGVRQLYEAATPRSHKTLSYIFQILPFVNREHNIVCHNPLEEDPDKIEPMTLGEFCDVVNYDRHNAARLCKALMSPTFTVGNREQHAVRCVLTKSMSREEYNIFINPRVYYAGTDYRKVETLGAFKD